MGRKLTDGKEKNENEVKIKPMPLPSSRNYVPWLGMLVTVKLNFNGVSFLKLCRMIQPIARKMEFL